MLQSFLISALKKKFAAAPMEAFSQVHPHDWLVWEPDGGWNPPATKTMARSVKAVKPKASSLGGEALAVALEPRPDGQAIIVGRSDCDFVVNDGTVSLRHLQFVYDGLRWTVADLSSRNGSTLDEISLGERPEPLFSGAGLTIGSVHLTYYLPHGMYERLGAKPKR